jgi:hypothetical protein
MDRLKTSRLVSNVRGVLGPSERSAPLQIEASGMLPVNANMGSLGTSNAVLGDMDGDALSVVLTCLGNSSLLPAIKEVRRILFRLFGRDVIRSTTKLRSSPVRC